VKLLRPREQDLFGFLVVWVWHATLDRAHRLACLVIEEPDALTASSGVDNVLAIAFADSIVGTFRLASAAVDAFVGNVGSHVAPFKTTV
jgi:hypothetical protein